MDMGETRLPIPGLQGKHPNHKPPVTRDETIEGFGLVTVVEAFIPGVDRLILDFDAGVPTPEVTFDTDLEAGSTAVLGNGLLMVVVRGATGLSPADVEIRELPADIDFKSLPKLQVIEGFDPEVDEIEILFDPVADAEPTVEVQDFADKSGAMILFNGRPVMVVNGAQGLRPEAVILVPRRGANS